MAERGRSPVRAALSRLPGWVTALGLILVLGELAGGAILLVAPSLAALGGGPRTVVLQVENAYSGDSATYTTPTGDGQFDMPFETPPLGQGSYSESGPTVTETVTVPAGGLVTIHTFSGYEGRLGCSITVNGRVLSQVTTGGFWDRATCRAKIP